MRIAKSEERLRTALGAGYPDAHILVYDELPSTNAVAREIGEAGAPHGSIVLAERQSAGRGRLGRSFASPNGGLYMSILLRPNMPASSVTWLTCAAAVATAGAIEHVLSGAGVRASVGIKWVNDLFLGGKKVAGILAEGHLLPGSDLLDSLVIGIGVNLMRGVLPPELREIAASLEEKTGVASDGIFLAGEAARRLLSLIASPSDASLADYRARQILLGVPVTVRRADALYAATPFAVGEDFSLCVRLADGRIERLTSGEVSIGSEKIARQMGGAGGCDER